MPGSAMTSSNSSAAMWISASGKEANAANLPLSDTQCSEPVIVTPNQRQRFLSWQALNPGKLRLHGQIRRVDSVPVHLGEPLIQIIESRLKRLIAARIRVNHAPVLAGRDARGLLSVPHGRH